LNYLIQGTPPGDPRNSVPILVRVSSSFWIIKGFALGLVPLQQSMQRIDFTEDNLNLA